MDLVPRDVERDELLARLADVIARAGWERFVSAPILLPSTTFFPDRWTRDAAGVHRLAKRLFLYAGLDLGVAVVDFEGDDPPSTGFHSDVAGFFAGIRDGKSAFGIHERHLEDDDAVVGVMCHEVAHAFRHVRALVGNDLDVEEENTDVTTIYLGFGVLTTNNAYRFRTSGQIQGGYTTSRWSESRIGYLSPEHMSFLLAACVVARDEDKKARRAIATSLEANQQAFFRAAVELLGADVSKLRGTLGLPPTSEWPPRVEVAALTVRLEDDAPVVKKKKKKKRRANEGEPTFRVIRRASLSGALIGATLGALVTGILQALDLILPGALLFAVGGWLVGGKFRHDICSDPSCEEPLPALVDCCPKCGGRIVGSIRKASERLEALEKYEDEQARIRREP